jgi:hypothetical protein
VWFSFGFIPVPGHHNHSLATGPIFGVRLKVRDLVAVAYESLSPKARESVFSERRQPRSKDKPVTRE